MLAIAASCLRVDVHGAPIHAWPHTWATVQLPVLDPSPYRSLELPGVCELLLRAAPMHPACSQRLLYPPNA